MNAPADAGVWRLRPDMELIPGTAENGAPNLLAHDPVAETFDRVEWPESDLLPLLREGGTREELLRRFVSRCTLRATERDVAEYLGHVAARGWLRSPRALPERFAPEKKPGGAAAFLAACMRLFFLRIPLARPDAFLRATAGAARLFWNPAFAALALCAAFAGAVLALPRWEEFLGVVAASANLAGAPGFLLALAALKAAHELAHAYAAALAGARVRSMGLALFLLVPLPFTDVTDAWRLEWPQRLRIAAAGLFAEASLGAAALLLWALSPPGEAAAALARLATVAVLSTLMTNLNPGLRFDGYFLLVCLTRAENLRAKGTAALRGALHRLFFGIRSSGTPENGTERGGAGLLLYAAYAAAYRVFIGAGLIVFAYAVLPKAPGLPVAALFAAAFFALPAAREVSLLWRLRGGMRFTAGTGILLLALLAGGVWFFGRWPRRLSFPAVTRAEAEEAVRARRPGIVRRISAVRGATVSEGDVLAELEAPEEEFLLGRAEWAVREAEIAAAQAWAGVFARRESRPREAELGRREEELSALQSQSGLLAVRASADGVLAEWDETLAPGVAVGEGSVLGVVVRSGAVRGAADGGSAGGFVDGIPAAYAACYPDVETAGRFAVGAEAWFWPDSGGAAVRGEVAAIGESAVAAAKIEDRELVPAFAAAAAPPPRVRVVVKFDAPQDRVGQTGVARVESGPESLAARAVVWLGNLAVRESAF